MRPPLLSSRVEKSRAHSAAQAAAPVLIGGRYASALAPAEASTAFARLAGVSVMAYLTAGVAPVTPALGVADWPSKAERLELAADRVDLRRGVGQVVGLDDLVERQRLHVELSVGERLQAVGARSDARIRRAAG